MRFFRTRSALVAGAITLAVAVGAVGVVVLDDVDEAFAQIGGNEVEGAIEALPADGVVGTWQVAGRTVTVTDTTEIDREGRTLAVGVRVEVDGAVQADGSILASEIEVDEPDSDDDGPGTGVGDDDGPSTATSAGTGIRGDDDD